MRFRTHAYRGCAHDEYRRCGRMNTGFQEYIYNYIDKVSATSSTALLLLRSVPVGVLEDIYEAGTGLKARAVLCARGDLVSLARLVGCGLAVHRQVQPPGDHYAPLPAVGVRRHLALLDGVEEDHLAVRARYQPAFDPSDRYIRFGHVLHPG